MFILFKFKSVMECVKEFEEVFVRGVKGSNRMFVDLLNVINVWMVGKKGFMSGVFFFIEDGVAATIILFFDNDDVWFEVECYKLVIRLVRDYYDMDF